MDRNLILAVVLSMLVFSGWSAWQASMAPPPGQETLAESGEALPADGDSDSLASPEGIDPGSSGRADDAASASASSRAAADTHALDSPAPATPASDDPPDWTGTLENDVATAGMTNRGATFTDWRLKDYFETPRREVPVDLLDLRLPNPAAPVTPFRELGLGDLSEAVYRVEAARHGEVVFVLDRAGVRIRKTYRQVEDEYGYSLEIQIENGTNRVLSPTFETVWPARMDGSVEQQQLGLIALANGDVERELVAGLGSPGFLGGLFGGGDDGPPQFRGDIGWAGTDLKYFAGLLVPPAGIEAKVVFEPLEKGTSGASILSLQPEAIAPGGSLRREFKAFMGPKDPSILAAAGTDFELSIDRGYSWVSPLTGFFEQALHMIHAVIPNYGLAIIVLTILVRLATLPIMAKQMKSAEKMRDLMPRIKELQEKFKDDKQKQSEETFKLYRETGVNPLAGCFPMVLQLPVFIGLFFALQSSIELRHAPFALWINDLSSPATLFTIPGLDFPVRLLPLLMGASMFGQQKMTPQTGMDPAQAKMMLIMMPGMMLFISYTFPSGLVLYWTVSNMLGIGHQLWVRRRMHAADAPAQ